jgi:hypothetical protein
MLKGEEFRDQVVVLSWHVDYWDYLGWKDPFGAKAHTERQKAYVPVLKARGLVTPQILVENALATKRWPEVIEKARRKPRAVKILADLTVEEGRLRAKVGLYEPEESLPEGAVVRPVLFQKKAVTEVSAGECAGRTLVEHFVVRRLGDPLPAVKLLEEAAKVSFDLPDGVEPSNLGLAVLVEDPKAMKTLESLSFDLPAAKPEPE